VDFPILGCEEKDSVLRRGLLSVVSLLDIPLILVTLFANQLGESPALEGSAGPLNDLQIVSKSGTPADVSKIEAALSAEDRKLNMLGGAKH
jgi:hypothetical protein